MAVARPELTDNELSEATGIMEGDIDEVRKLAAEVRHAAAPSAQGKPYEPGYRRPGEHKYAALRRIYAADRSLGPRELVDRSGVSRATVSQFVQVWRIDPAILTVSAEDPILPGESLMDYAQRLYDTHHLEDGSRLTLAHLIRITGSSITSLQNTPYFSPKKDAEDLRRAIPRKPREHNYAYALRMARQRSDVASANLLRRATGINLGQAKPMLNDLRSWRARGGKLLAPSPSVASTTKRPTMGDVAKELASLPMGDVVGLLQAADASGQALATLMLERFGIVLGDLVGVVRSRGTWDHLASDIVPLVITQAPGWPTGRGLDIVYPDGGRYALTPTASGYTPVALHYDPQARHYAAEVNGAVVPVKPDGDCFYASVLWTLGPDAARWMATADPIGALRESLAQWMESRPEVVHAHWEALMQAGDWAPSPSVMTAVPAQAASKATPFMVDTGPQLSGFPATATYNSRPSTGRDAPPQLNADALLPAIKPVRLDVVTAHRREAEEPRRLHRKRRYDTPIEQSRPSQHPWRPTSDPRRQADPWIGASMPPVNVVPPLQANWQPQAAASEPDRSISSSWPQARHLANDTLPPSQRALYDDQAWHDGNQEQSREDDLWNLQMGRTSPRLQ